MALFALIVTLVATGVIEDDEIDVTDLDPGDCVELDVDAEEVRELPRTECDEPHDGEVYLVDDIELDSDEYPGLAALGVEIEERCTGPAFEDYVGVPYPRSELAYSYLYPVEDGWERGDREFVCVAVEADGSRLFESVEGSGR